MFRHFVGFLCTALFALAPQVQSADINREWVDFTPPAEIKWVKNPNGNNASVILFGNSRKPGP